MKALAKFLTVVTLAVVLLGAYMVRASHISITPAGTLVESAADRQSAFDSLTTSAAVGSPGLILYNTSDISSDPGEYVFVTYTLDIRNRNLLNAEWLQIELNEQEGDVLMIKPVIEDIAPMSSEQISLVLMTHRSNSTSYIRFAEVTYYVYGHEYTFPVELGKK